MLLFCVVSWFAVSYICIINVSLNDIKVDVPIAMNCEVLACFPVVLRVWVAIMDPFVKIWLYVGEFDPFAIYFAKHFAYYHIAVKSKSSAKVNLLCTWCSSILYQIVCLLEVVKCLIMFLDIMNDAPSQDFLQVLRSFFKISAIFLFHLLCSFSMVLTSFISIGEIERALLSVLVIRSSRTKRDQHHLLSLNNNILLWKK